MERNPNRQQQAGGQEKPDCQSSKKAPDVSLDQEQREEILNWRTEILCYRHLDLGMDEIEAWNLATAIVESSADEILKEFLQEQGKANLELANASTTLPGRPPTLTEPQIQAPLPVPKSNSVAKPGLSQFARICREYYASRPQSSLGSNEDAVIQPAHQVQANTQSRGSSSKPGLSQFGRKCREYYASRPQSSLGGHEESEIEPAPQVEASRGPDNRISLSRPGLSQYGRRIREYYYEREEMVSLPQVEQEHFEERDEPTITGAQNFANPLFRQTILQRRGQDRNEEQQPGVQGEAGGQQNAAHQSARRQQHTRPEPVERPQYMGQQRDHQMKDELDELGNPPWY